MKKIEFKYVTTKVVDGEEVYIRDVETFPLKKGVITLKKHPNVSIQIMGYDKERFYYLNGDEIESATHTSYVTWTIKSRKDYEEQIFMESLMTSDDFAAEKPIRTLLKIENATLEIKEEYFEKDIYSESDHTKKYEMPVNLDNCIHLEHINADLFIKQIKTNSSLVVIVGYYPTKTGAEIKVTSKKEGIFDEYKTGGHNDQWFATHKIVKIRLIK